MAETTAPLVPLAVPTSPSWCDYNGHLNEGYYAVIFGDATEHAARQVGLGAPYRERAACSLYTVRTETGYLREVAEAATVTVRTEVTRVTGKALCLRHEMVSAGTVVATQHSVGLHVDVAAGRTTEFPEDLLRDLRARVAGVVPDCCPASGTATGAVR